MKIPHCTPGVWPSDLPTSRFAAHVHQAMTTGCRVAILGLPDDTGVRLNSGRPGAAGGPRTFREALSRYGVSTPDGFNWPKVFDAGDVTPAPGHGADAMLETHMRIREATTAILKLGLFPIAIGGGHDLTLPFVRAVVEHTCSADEEVFGGIYFDAHLDVRNTPGSGMAFRRLVEDHAVGPLLIAGFNPLANAREFVRWFLDHDGEIADPDWTSQLSAEQGAPPAWLSPLADCDHLFCSFDLDCLDASQAPGVSAMNPDGLGVADAARAVFTVACDPRLRCLDFMEFSPAHDEGGRTGRVLAHLFLYALMGLRLSPSLQHPELD